MKVVVAVSGGIDSVVLLDMIARGELYRYSDDDVAIQPVAVAHFDHGMRPSSQADARFVEGLANRYKLSYVGRRQELLGANEDVARRKRYNFLFDVAGRLEAELVTAHHLDDLVETIALNISRGTRWRGLTGMGDQRIWRPLLRRTKSELEQYAIDNCLEWTEDETNRQDIYLRNRLRKKLVTLPYDQKQYIYRLWQDQTNLRQQIDQEITRLESTSLSRYFLTMIDPPVAREILYSYVMRHQGVSLLSLQLDHMLMAVKLGKPTTSWQIGQGVVMKLTARDVTIIKDVSLSKG